MFYYCAKIRLFDISKLVKYCSSIDREIVRVKLEFFFFFRKLHEKGYDKGDSIQFPSESSKKGNLSAKGSN